MSAARFIYFLRRSDGTGPVKIGCSTAPTLRLKQLQSDLHVAFTLLATAPGGYTVEKNLHHKFREARAKLEGAPVRPYPIGCPTEWFSPVAELMAFVAKVATSGKIPLTQGERLEVIFGRRWMAGETLRAIGRDYGLSHERIRQILNEHGYPTNAAWRRQYLFELRRAA
jgi:hypothetical protein